ncbi:hypothetical protein OG552_30055 [Streptomyces sp. NBC_01476]|nr:hypothetical protein [Streptomyces sp. NBC_01476]
MITVPSATALRLRNAFGRMAGSAAKLGKMRRTASTPRRNSRSSAEC